MLAKAASDDKLTVCIDEVYAGLSNNDQCEVLFGADGVVTPYLKRVLEFVQAFHVEAQRTTVCVARLKALGLLVPKVINVERIGDKHSMRGLKGAGCGQAA